jgi:outer membrane protein TolC
VATFTLTNAAAIKLQTFATDIALSAYEIQSGFFDINTSAGVSGIQGRPRDFYLPGQEDMDSQVLTLGASKLFRTGISSNLSVTVRRDDHRATRGVGPGSRPLTQNISTVTFTVNVPLLKGRGYTSAAAEETAAQLSSEAAVQAYYNKISDTLKAAISAYWDYKATTETLKALQGSQQRILGWVDEAKKGAEATGNAKAVYQKFAPQISRLDAFLADQEHKVSEATEQVNQAKVALALAMGTTPDQVGKIGEPAEEFPRDWSKIAARFDKGRAMQKWIAGGLEKRFDLQAAKLSEQAAATKLAKARQDVLPKLDLGLTAGRGAIEVGDSFSKFKDSLSPPTADKRGGDLTVALNLAYPLGNHVAKGQLGVATATHQQSLLQFNEALRGARLQIAMSIGSLANGLQSVEKARQAVAGYEPALEKYKGGQGIVSDPVIIFNLIDLEKDLVDAITRYIKSLLDLAKTLVSLRHQTGILIDVNPTTGEATLTKSWRYLIYKKIR